MEKGKATSIKKYFIANTVQAVLVVPAIILFWWFLFVMCINVGIILPADTSSNEARAAMQELQELDRFEIGTSNIHYDYILFEPNGSVQKSSMSDNETAELADKYPVSEKNYTSADYVHFSDGSYCLFIWNHHSFIADLHGVQADGVLIVAMLVTILIFFAVFIRRISRQFYREIGLIEDATKTITARNIETEIVPSSTILEFKNALNAMEEMRVALNDSLKEQWALQQRRKNEIAALAHDLRTPVTAINGNAELLLEEELLPHQREYAKDILTSGEQTKQYLKLLEQVSEFDFVHEDLVLINIDTLLNEVLGVTSAAAALKGVRIEVENKTQKIIIGYPLVLSRALTNVLDNAVRFTPEGGCIELSVSGNSGQTAFSISDSGRGFSKGALRHASEMFWKEDELSVSEKHYGLGIAIASRAAEAHRGFLTLENTEKGGRVSITITDGHSGALSQ